jgi:hypothetical protein
MEATITAVGIPGQPVSVGIQSHAGSVVIGEALEASDSADVAA